MGPPPEWEMEVRREAAYLRVVYADQTMGVKPTASKQARASPVHR